MFTNVFLMKMFEIQLGQIWNGGWNWGGYDV